MSRTIKRGAPPKRPAPRRKQPVKKVPLLDRIVEGLGSAPLEGSEAAAEERPWSPL